MPHQKFAFKALPSTFELTDNHRHYQAETYKRNYLEAYLVDTSMCNFNIKDILQNDVLPIMETVYENY